MAESRVTCVNWNTATQYTPRILRKFLLRIVSNQAIKLIKIDIWYYSIGIPLELYILTSQEMTIYLSDCQDSCKYHNVSVAPTT